MLNNNDRKALIFVGICCFISILLYQSSTLRSYIGSILLFIMYGAFISAVITIAIKPFNRR